MNIPKIGSVTPYPFQWEVVQNTLAHIRKQLKKEIEPTPAYMNAYVSAGKTVIGGAIANHCKNVGAKLLILARTGELVEQNSDECWNMDTQASVYSASLGLKSTHFNVVVGSEGTVANALCTAFSSWIPHIILIDECHEVHWEEVLNGKDKFIEDIGNQYARILNHFMRINPNVVIIGMTGSPYRGTESIKGPFWKEVIKPEVERKFLVDGSYIVPTIFGYGHDDIQYDLHEFAPPNELGTADFSNADLERQHALMKRDTTKAIMNEVQEVMKNRLCALVTCAGLKHCEEAAACVPADECAIVTEATNRLERKAILDGARKGELNDRGTFRYKYIFQVGCLSVGVNIPLWDVSVLLRRIGSLTLLTQLLGRGMRLLKPFHIDAGHQKSDHLVLDYSGTLESMAELFNDPLLEDAQLSKAKQDGQYIECPICSTQNSAYARRCIGADTIGDQPDGRCGHWWKFRACEDQKINGILIEKGCGHRNDIAARSCSNCGKYLIDPNEKLTRKHYTDEDWKPVALMVMGMFGKNNEHVKVKYYLESFGLDGQREVAEVNYWATSAGGKHVFQGKFVNSHMKKGLWNKVKSMNAASIVYGDVINQPLFITHRHNEKGESIVHGVDFSGVCYTARKQA